MGNGFRNSGNEISGEADKDERIAKFYEALAGGLDGAQAVEERYTREELEALAAEFGLTMEDVEQALRTHTM